MIKKRKLQSDTESLQFGPSAGNTMEFGEIPNSPTWGPNAASFLMWDLDYSEPEEFFLSGERYTFTSPYKI